VKSVRYDEGAGAPVVVVAAAVVDGATGLDVGAAGAGGALGLLDVVVVPFPDLTPVVHPAARAAARTTAPPT
jgi:hypothetical protein